LDNRIDLPINAPPSQDLLHTPYKFVNGYHRCFVPKKLRETVFGSLSTNLRNKKLESGLQDAYSAVRLQAWQNRLTGQPHESL
jgi:hypothetical protein